MGIINKIQSYFFQKAVNYLSSADFGLVGRIFGQEWNDRTYIEQYGKSLYVHACVSKIAEKYSTVDFKLKRIINSKGDVKEVKNHEILDLIYRWNPFMTKEEAMELDIINRKLSGDSFILKVRNSSGQVAELWPISPLNVIIHTDPIRFVDYYEIVSAEGKKQRVEADDMIHIKYPSPLNQYLGLSPLSAAKQRVDSEGYAVEHQKNTFLNNGRPDAVVQSDQTPPMAQRIEIRKDYEKKHKGQGKNSKVAFLWGGLKYQQISLSPQELDFIESMKFTRDDIMVAFKCPKSIFGITEDVNRANAETGMRIFYSETINPEAIRWANKINEELIIPEFGEEYYIEPVNQAPVDREQRLAEFDKGVDRWITVNEIRSEMGLEPIDGGDQLYRTLTVQPLGEQMEINREPDNSKNLHGRRALRIKMETKEAFFGEIKKIQDEAKNKIKKSFSKEIKDNSIFKDKDRRKKYWSYRMKDIDKKSAKIKKLVNQLASAQADEFIAKFEKNPPKSAAGIKKLFSIKNQIKKFSKAIMPLIISIFEEARNDARDLVDEKMIKSENKKDITPSILDLLQKRADFFAESVNNTTLLALVATIDDGIKEEEGIPELKKRIKGVYVEFENYRATLIARTETNAVVNEAHLQTYKDSEVIEGKEWIATMDDRVRDEHLMMDGEIVAKGRAFSNGLMFPSEPNCRCTVAPVINLKD